MPSKTAATALCGFLSTVLLAGLTGRPACAGTLTTLYSFTNGTDGGDALGGVIEDANGTIYGETYAGGGASCTTRHSAGKGCGTIYSFSPSTGLKVLAAFTGSNGAHGNIALTLVGQTLYGATEDGGTTDDGVIFSIGTDGTGFTLLHQFSGPDGSNPVGSLVVAQDGTLYGVTQAGGNSNSGVLFSITATGVYSVVHSFALPGGVAPNALVAGSGILVGSTMAGGPTSSSGCTGGCGTYFGYSLATEKFATIYDLPASGAQGNIPNAGSVGPGPTVYGIQTESISSLSQKSGFSAVAQLNYYTVGSQPPSGPVYASNDVVYGILGANAFVAPGAIYSEQNGVIQDLYYFDGLQHGGTPVAKPYITLNGSLIGTTTKDGRCGNCGTIWQYTP